MSKKGIFGGLKDTKLTQDAVYIRPGQYLCRIDKCKIFENRKGMTRAAVEMTVIALLDPDSTHKVGEEITQLMRRESDYFLPDVLGFLTGVLGVDQESIGEEELEQLAAQVFSDENPLGNTICELHARNVVTNEGKDFTKIIYKGEVEPAKALEILDEAVIERFFPNNLLQKMAESQN